jgi:hypothetical protein
MSTKIRILKGREATALALLTQENLPAAVRARLRSTLKGSAARIAARVEGRNGKLTANERLAAKTFVTRYKVLKQSFGSR